MVIRKLTELTDNYQKLQGRKVQRINSINHRWKIDRGRVRIV